jgi:hypothetical protein
VKRVVDAEDRLDAARKNREAAERGRDRARDELRAILRKLATDSG